MPNNEWGDFQTPEPLAAQIADLVARRGSFSRVLEPTCGHGSFIRAVRDHLHVDEILGIEVQEHYADRAEETGATIVRQSIFDLDLRTDLPWHGGGRLLVIGNPPWVTNAELSGAGSANLPEKRNLRNVRGIDALTGSSNFDIAEYIFLKLILELADEEPVIALLCKTQVARRVLEFCFERRVAISDATIHRIDAKSWFDASVDACLFTIAVGGRPDWRCHVLSSLGSGKTETTMGFGPGGLVPDIERYEATRFADGLCQVEWRQGVKHDAASVMELTRVSDDKLLNKLGEVVEVEPEFVYPLLKSTDLNRGSMPTRCVIVTQRSIGEDTAVLADRAPRLWSYLTSHEEYFTARRSSIYRGRPRFSIFGIGAYSFSPAKVAVSGFHKTPIFRLVLPQRDVPVMFDDTCYFLAFDRPSDAALTAVLLNASHAQDFLVSLAFRDSKRPITKKLLQRVDLLNLLEKSDSEELLSAARQEAPELRLDSDCVDLLVQSLTYNPRTGQQASFELTSP